MNRKRKLKSNILKSLTFLASFLTLFVLAAIFSFVMIKGKNSLNMEMIRNPYWSKNFLVSIESTDKKFEVPFDLKDNQAFSQEYGIVFEDSINHEKKEQITVAYIDKNSPFNNVKDLSVGGVSDKFSINLGDQIEKIDLVIDGDKESIGIIYGHGAQDISDYLDLSSSVDNIYYKTKGGGIWGSLLATLMLIIISLIIAFPVGLFTAIYLNEIAPNKKTSVWISKSIDLLAGVPSIVFGLMGVTVLYPITSFFNIQGLSILLGSLTMAVILLPIVIGSIKESLSVIPLDYREASLSLGATTTQTVFKVVLPSALPGILSALLLSISRIIGESAALIYTMGTFINDSPVISKGATTLAVHIWSVMNQEQPNFELASAISLIILFLVLLLNIMVKLMSKKLNRKLGVEA